MEEEEEMVVVVVVVRERPFRNGVGVKKSSS
jgi:hypothetical protein